MASWGDTSAALNGNGTIAVPGGYKVGPDGQLNLLIVKSHNPTGIYSTREDPNGVPRPPSTQRQANGVVVGVAVLLIHLC